MNRIIPIDIYNTDLLLVIGTQEELKVALEKYLEKEDAEEAYNMIADGISDISLGRSALLDSGQVALWMPAIKNKGTLAHEIFHIVCYIMEKIGVGFCHESDEAYAYLIGYITNKVNDVINSSCEPVSQ